MHAQAMEYNEVYTGEDHDEEDAEEDRQAAPAEEEAESRLKRLTLRTLVYFCMGYLCCRYLNLLLKLVNLLFFYLRGDVPQAARREDRT